MENIYMNREKIKNLIDKYEIISFDIFDTLIKRNCRNYLDVYKLCEKRIQSMYLQLDNYDFYSDRIRAEINAYKKYQFPTIDEIYEEIKLPQELKNSIKNVEIEVEFDLICKNYEIMEVYQYAKSRNKKIIAVSDMYLQNKILKQLLQSVGIFIDDIFVSCDWKADKSSGCLFIKVMNEMNISRDNILHIGDNFKADFLGGKKANITSLYYRYKNQKLQYYRNRKDEYLYPFILNNISLLDNPIQRLGFEVMGPIVYGFCDWIYNVSQRENYDVLFFCARDSFQTYQNYIRMHPDEKEKCRYMYVSLTSLEAPYKACISNNVSEKEIEQLKNIRQYFKERGIRGKVGIVDSGFGGHTQEMLKNILSDSIEEIHGIYMRISNEFARNTEDKKVAPYLYLNNKDRVFAKISGAFFEFLISASHGRTIRYEKTTEGTMPVLDDSSFDSTIIDEFQLGIQKFIDSWGNKLGCSCPINKKDIEKSFYYFSFFPKFKHVQLIKNATHGNEIREPIVLEYNNKSILCFLKKLEKTTWKGGFFVDNTRFAHFLCFVYLKMDMILQKILGY